MIPDPMNGVEDVAVSQGSEGMARARRRQFTAEEKLRVLRAADSCTRPGEVGALLRREGLYSSHLTAWRAARSRGERAGLMPRPRGPRANSGDPRDRRLTELERQTRRLAARLERIERLVLAHDGHDGNGPSVAAPPPRFRTREADRR